MAQVKIGSCSPLNCKLPVSVKSLDCTRTLWCGHTLPSPAISQCGFNHLVYLYATTVRKHRFATVLTVHARARPVFAMHFAHLKPTKTEELLARKHDESHAEDMQSNTNDSSICADSFVWCTYAIGGLPSGFFRLHFLPSAHGKKLIGFQVLMQYKRFLRRL